MIVNLENLLNLSNDIFQKKELKPLFTEIAAVSKYLWDRGWAERNAGNFSINVTGLFNENELERLSAWPFLPLSKNYPDLVGKLFIVTGAGTRMRDIAVNPVQNLCFVYISDTGSAYHIIDANHEMAAVRPTSELATHLAIQQQLVQEKSDGKVVLHAHVTELISLTQLPPFTSEESINTLVWGMHPETMLFLPEGVGFIPFTIPGTESIAQATLTGFRNHKVVLWEKHGSMAVGHTLSDAFDNLDLISKAARIYLLSAATGIQPEGLSSDQLTEIRNSIC